MNDCPDLEDISVVIDRMKRGLALDKALSVDDLRAIRRLIRRLDHGGGDCSVRYGIIDELRDLAR